MSPSEYFAGCLYIVVVWGLGQEHPTHDLDFAPRLLNYYYSCSIFVCSYIVTANEQEIEQDKVEMVAILIRGLTEKDINNVLISIIWCVLLYIYSYSYFL